MKNKFTPRFRNNIASVKFFQYFLFWVFVISCSPTSEISKQVYQISDPLVKQAKESFEQSIKNFSKARISSKKVEKQPQWHLAKTTKLPFGDIVEVPVLYNGAVPILVPGNHDPKKIAKDEKWRGNSATKMFMYRRSDSQEFTYDFHTIVEEVANKNKRTDLSKFNIDILNDFTGYFLIENFDGSKVRGSYFQKGKIKGTFQLTSPLSNKRIGNLLPGLNCRSEIFTVYLLMCYDYDSNGSYESCSWEYGGSFQGQICDE